ncbi:hypothetical protein [Klebsiella aerogenes]|jgi:hypothetical protein|uniref:hypothetical protein n=1 Tax=Klebsiella aerogenes TaxID=548 RepID=UPI00045353EB|nr:hypothetical protein [Klebsiella aerogenes]EUL49396.1 hypothetical protein P849_03530 [Klebsiella aerogenes UCI 46]KJN04941.1 hypothetical protein SS60_09825 [Klebsiella aerogenes]KLE60422.1 hypothetical protein YA14_05330 [Klebsiella aerogenes]KLE82384.1 hypothetical protein YA18_10840 [Klebsiella aerogenes]KLF28791.1 hypothetical protein YA30_08460 [Klebsiella aerogenes]
MRKRERSNIVRIEKAARATKRKFTTTLKDYARESIPGELITTVREYPAAVPTGSEFELLQDVLSSTDNVYYKPRRRREYQVDSSNLQHWQVLGFQHYADYVGYSQTNGLSGHTADFDFIFHDEKEIHD